MKYLLSKTGCASRIRNNKEDVKKLIDNGYTLEGEILDSGKISPISFQEESKTKRVAKSKKEEPVE